MTDPSLSLTLDGTGTDVFTYRANQLYREHADRIHRNTDRAFVVLLLVQWLGGILTAVLVSPNSWAGAQSSLHLHVMAAVFLGGVLVAGPAALYFLAPGHAATRHTIAASQMLFGALLIHLSGGRIETHFHIFGSLAFLAVYRDWRVFVTATVIVVLDHALRGVFYPQSVYGVAGGAEWRWLEHAGWVVFEDAFLVVACFQMQAEMRDIALRHAELESTQLVQRYAREMRELASKNESLALEAMAATRAKSEFLATMSHELRTPMNAIINYADLSVRRGTKAMPSAADKPTIQQQMRFASEIRGAGERLLTLINQLLDLSRVEAGRMELNLEEARAADVVDRVERIVSTLVADNENELTVRCDPDLKFRTDVQRLEQCIINLLGNAAKFTHKGRITLDVQRAPRPNYAIITVSDTGIGMTADQMTRLFVPFSQADASITRRYGGTGLGLAITHSIVTLLGGTVGVTSEQYKGSTFTITVPTVLDEASARVPMPAPLGRPSATAGPTPDYGMDTSPEPGARALRPAGPPTSAPVDRRNPSPQPGPRGRT